MGKQGAIQLGLWTGVGRGLAVGMLSLSGEYALSPRVALDAGFGLQRRSDGSLDPRDATMSVTWRALNTDTLVLNVRPGLSIPTGGLGTGFAFTPLSTASVDPRLRVDAAIGSTWLFLPSFTTRVPVYKGWDDRLQGPFLRGDLRGARRFSDVVPWVGLSLSHQMEGSHPLFTPPMTELAGTVGAFWAIAERWGVSAQGRAPLWVDGAASPIWSASVACRYVIKKTPKADEH